MRTEVEGGMDCDQHNLVIQKTLMFMINDTEQGNLKLCFSNQISLSAAKFPEIIQKGCTGTHIHTSFSESKIREKKTDTSQPVASRITPSNRFFFFLFSIYMQYITHKMPSQIFTTLGKSLPHQCCKKLQLDSGSDGTQQL